MDDIISNVALPSQENWLFVEELKQNEKRVFAKASKLEKETIE